MLMYFQIIYKNVYQIRFLSVYILHNLEDKESKYSYFSYTKLG